MGRELLSLILGLLTVIRKSGEYKTPPLKQTRGCTAKGIEREQRTAKSMEQGRKKGSESD